MNFSKDGIIKKQNKLKSKTKRVERRFFIDFLKILLALIVLVILCLAGAGFGGYPG